MPFFLFGFIYYLISPAFVFRFLSEDNEILTGATRYLNPGYFDGIYFLDTAVILVAFLTGYFLARFLVGADSSIADRGSSQASFPGVLAVSFAALIAYLAASASLSGADFFTGYSTYNILVLGPFSTCVFLSAWFINYFSRKQIRFLFLSFFAVCSVLLLGWGSRMYFVLGFMALIIGVVSNNRRLLGKLWFHGLLALACISMIVIGIAREGGREFSGDNLLAVLFAEPLFTSISGSLYLDGNDGRPTYGVPNDLLASVIHFIPSSIFPGKLELISEITLNEKVASPFGAKSLLVSLYSNFGIFYPAFILSVGFYYGFLYKKARQSVFYRATYFSALPVLIFLFFRETLTTVIKVMFFNGLILPFAIALSLVWLFRRQAATSSRIPTYHTGRNSGA